MAKAAGVIHRSVQRIWAAYGLAPHRVRTFKRSKDPKFVDKVLDVAGLYVDPPEHALALGRREEPDPGARTRPHAAGPADEKGPLRDAMTRDYKRHGTTTLFTALKRSLRPSRCRSSARLGRDSRGEARSGGDAGTRWARQTR